MAEDGNGSGTTIGFGAQMYRYQLTYSGTDIHGAPITEYDGPEVDVNLNLSGTIAPITDVGDGFLEYFYNQPVDTTGGGGMIVNGGYRQWINGLPLAVNSAGQVLGLQNSATNNSPTANSYGTEQAIGNFTNSPSASGYYIADFGPWDPYFNSVDIDNVPYPTIWVPQTNSGTVSYVPVKLTMQTGQSFTGTPVNGQPEMFFNTNMQVLLTIRMRWRARIADVLVRIAYYLFRNNLNGTVIGLGATMDRYQPTLALSVMVESDPGGTVTTPVWTTTSAPLDVNVSISGTPPNLGFLTGQTLTTPAGGYIANGGSTKPGARPGCSRRLFGPVPPPGR